MIYAGNKRVGSLENIRDAEPGGIEEDQHGWLDDRGLDWGVQPEDDSADDIIWLRDESEKEDEVFVHWSYGGPLSGGD